MNPYRRNNFKVFIFILTFVIIMILLTLFTLTKAFTPNSNKEKIISANEVENNIIPKNTNNIIIMENINPIVDNEETQNNIVNNEIDIKNENVEDTIEEPNNNKKFGSNVAFIGNSRTQAFLMYTGLNDVIDYTNVGLMVDTAITKKFITNDEGEKITILEDLENRNIDTVYIMLGINELGWVYSSIFIKNYEELIDKIREVKPDCEIIIQSIIPVTKTKSDNDSIYNNKKISEYNALIKEMSDRKKIKFVNLVPALADENGNLPENASPDGVHLNKEYCLKWLECLKNN